MTEIPERLTTVEALVDHLGRVDFQSILYQARRSQAIREWALSNLGIDYGIGDRVEIVNDFAAQLTLGHGWYGSREALHQGATALVQDIDINPRSMTWYAEIILDREWTTSGEARGSTRFWHGPAAETPAGYEAPTKYDQEHFPEGRKHTFPLPVGRLRALDVAS